MAYRNNAFSLPLLTKELIELAARRRTWIVRGCAVGLLMLFVMWSNVRLLGLDPIHILGRGEDIFHVTVGWLFFGIHLLVPLSTFASISSERERDTLDLLLITRLTPLTIALEKLLSRLVPACLFLFASMPLLAVAYALGGVTTAMIVNAVWTLLLSALFCASIALLSSAWTKTATSSFYYTILLGLALTMGPFIAHELIQEFADVRLIRLVGMDEGILFSLFGPAVFASNMNRELSGSLLMGLPILINALVCLLLTARFMVTRSAPAKKTLSQKLLALLDRLIDAIFRRIGIKAGPTDSENRSIDLPQDESVAWLERRSLFGRPRHQWIALIVMEGLLIVSATYFWQDRELAEFSVFCIAIIWPTAVASVCGKASSVFGVERSRQTLEVLLTTPLSSKELLLQKMAGVQRLILGWMAIFATAAAMLTVGALQRDWDRQPLPLAILALMVTAGIYLPLLGWIAMSIGLSAKNASRALVQTVVTVVAWCVGPGVLFLCCAEGIGNGLDSDVTMGFMGPILSPAMMPVISAIAFVDDDPFEKGFFFVFLWNTAIYGVALLAVRAHCLERVDYALSRSGPRIGLTERQPPKQPAKQP